MLRTVGFAVLTFEAIEMANGLSRDSASSRQGSGGDGRPEFVAFRNRLSRLVEALLALRDLPPPDHAWAAEPERVEVRLESDAVIVEFVVAQLPWDVASTLVRNFQVNFARSTPIFLETYGRGDLTLTRSRPKEGSFAQVCLKENTTLTFEKRLMTAGYSIKIQTNLHDFDDHFEVFTTDAARTLFPPIEKAGNKKHVTDLESWHKEFGRAFEETGCRVLRETSLGWSDLIGLDHVRERLNRSIFQPLSREQLYQKIAQRVIPHAVNVLPRGVLLHGPPGCGKTWSMRVIASEAGLPVVVLPCQAVLTKWYGESENRLARVFELCRQAGRMILLIDELDALARHRNESHETTARMVSILLAELDGLAESNQVLLVGSANDVTALDWAVVDRFDLKIEFRPPDRDQLQAALAYYARQLSPVEIAEVAERLDGWNFRQLARFAEDVVRVYVSGLDLTLLETGEPPLPQKDDYLAALGRCLARSVDTVRHTRDAAPG